MQFAWWSSRDRIWLARQMPVFASLLASSRFWARRPNLLLDAVDAVQKASRTTNQMRNFMPSATLLTTTWAGDALQFGMLRASLKRSALAEVPHHVVVHNEDRAAFSGYASEIRLRSTAEVLPGNLEAARCLARAWQSRLGQHGTRWISSLTRLIGIPAWPRYLGWQIQQISKLASIAQTQSDTVLVLDSDVVVTPQVRVDDCPWWNAILAQPPRRRSEFATYRLFLRQHPPDCGVNCQSPALMHYVFEADRTP